MPFKPILIASLKSNPIRSVATIPSLVYQQYLQVTLVLCLEKAKMTSPRMVFINGVASNSSEAPSVSTFLQTHQGAYTTTRTHNSGSCLMFWERHVTRLVNSVRILCNLNPQLLFKSADVTIPSLVTPISSSSLMWESMIKSLVDDSLNKALPVALKERRDGEELAITVLVEGDFWKLSGIDDVSGCGSSIRGIFDVHAHFSGYMPFVFGVQGGGARLAVVGRGRDIAEAKYSDWVRLRKPLEKLRPPTVSELLLSNDGDRILEGSVTNFFVVCRKDNKAADFEVQTAPISDGVLPGVIRQLVTEVCISKGIPLREVAPSWSEHELWEEAFITNSLRLLQHVESIQVPRTWELQESKCWDEIAWKEKQFERSPGRITKVIQKEIMDRAGLESCTLNR